MDKLELIALLTGLDERGETYRRLVEAATGKATAPEEKLLGLKDVARELGYHPTWLTKLGVHKRCGIRMGGRRRYCRSEVAAFMASDACQDALAEVRGKRSYGKARR